MIEICTQSDRPFPPVADHVVDRGPGRNASPLPAAVRQLRRAVRRLLIERLADTWRERRRREHSELLELDEHMLYDVGLTRVDIERLTGFDPWQQEEQVYGKSSRWLDQIHLHR